jgi:hypothetical protein
MRRTRATMRATALSSFRLDLADLPEEIARKLPR